MGNIGRSSTGCYLCRKRKIKCDEAKPGCRKCAQIRKQCPGYPFSMELDVGSDSSTSQAQPKSAVPVPVPLSASIPIRPAVLAHTVSESRVPQVKSFTRVNAPQSAISTSDDDARSESAETESHNTRSSSVKLEGPSLERALNVVPAHRTPSPAPKYDVQHQSTWFFLNLFCWQATTTYGAAILDYLPEMLLQSPPDSCLHQATRAVSRMALADRYSGYDVRLQSGKDYVKALSMTKAAIRDSSEAVKDETITAVWMLGLYENINSVLSHGRLDRQYRSVEEEYQSHTSHIRGAMNLLRLRGKSQLDKGRSEKIYRVFKATIQMRLFNLNSVLSTDFENLEQDIYKDEHEFLPSKSAVQATDFFHGAAHLLEQAKHTLRKYRQLPNSIEIAAELQRILESGERLDASMAGWSEDDDEPGWALMRIKSSTKDSTWALYPSHAIFYVSNFWVLMYWLRFFVARIKLYEGMIVVAQWLEKTATMSQTQVPRAGKSTQKPSMTSSDHESKIQQYRDIIQLAASQIIGLTAYALGDVTNQGTFYSSAATTDPSSGSREVNVIAALQLVIPLKVLQRSDGLALTPAQRGAIDLALSHIGDGFRRQPMLI